MVDRAVTALVLYHLEKHFVVIGSNGPRFLDGFAKVIGKTEGTPVKLCLLKLVSGNKVIHGSVPPIFITSWPFHGNLSG
jgi:hypothetical protein